MIKKIGGWGNLITLLLVIGFITFGLMRKFARVKSPCYIKGICRDILIRTKGSKYYSYDFEINGNKYQGEVPVDFCDNCCKVGDSVIIRFQQESPENNDLVMKLPEGINFDVDGKYCPNSP